LGVAVAMLAAEALDICRWGAERIVIWAARRWRKRSSVDHAEERLDDLKERPGKHPYADQRAVACAGHGRPA
jgi:hypothetical protein